MALVGSVVGGMAVAAAGLAASVGLYRLTLVVLSWSAGLRVTGRSSRPSAPTV